VELDWQDAKNAGETACATTADQSLATAWPFLSILSGFLQAKACVTWLSGDLRGIFRGFGCFLVGWHIRGCRIDEKKATSTSPIEWVREALGFACRRKESLTLVVSPSARQSGELVRRAAGFASRLGITPKGDGDNEISLGFPNGSRIVGGRRRRCGDFRQFGCWWMRRRM
jgi:hypothetical protein